MKAKGTTLLLRRKTAFDGKGSLSCLTGGPLALSAADCAPAAPVLLGLAPTVVLAPYFLLLQQGNLLNERFYQKTQHGCWHGNGPTGM